MDDTVVVGEFTLTYSGEVRSIKNEKTVKKVTCSGRQWLFDLARERTIVARIAYVEWENSEREVRTVARSKWGPQYWRIDGPDSLYEHFIDRERLRLVIERHGADDWLVTLQQARIGDDGRPQLHHPTEDELRLGSQVNCELLFKRLGATQYGPRRAVKNDRSNNRRLFCVTFPEHNKIVPVAAFVVTRIFPVYYGLTKDFQSIKPPLGMDSLMKDG